MSALAVCLLLSSESHIVYPVLKKVVLVVDLVFSPTQRFSISLMGREEEMEVLPTSVLFMS